MRKLAFVVLWLLLGLSYADAASRFGVCSTTCTWDGSSTAMWAATSGGATGQSVPGAADTVTFDASTCVGGTTCTITVNTTVSVQSITFSACTGTTTGCILDFSVNNNNVTLSATVNALNCTGSGTRTLHMGTGNWNFTASAANSLLSCAAATNLTLDGNSTIEYSGTTVAGAARTLNTGGKSFFNFKVSGSGGISNQVLFSGGGAFTGTVTATVPITLTNQSTMTFGTLTTNSAMSIIVTQSTTLTISNAPTTVGASCATPVTILSSIPLTAAGTISVASGTVRFNCAAITTMTFSGGATFAANGIDGGGNTGITISPIAASGGIIGGN